MRGSEYLEIETLYNLELQLLRYPGLELEAILEDVQITHEEPDDETGELQVVFDAFPQDMLVFRFRGPAYSDKGRPASIVPVVADGVDDEDVRGFAIEAAVDSLERLIKNNSESHS